MFERELAILGELLEILNGMETILINVTKWQHHRPKISKHNRPYNGKNWDFNLNY